MNGRYMKHDEGEPYHSIMSWKDTLTCVVCSRDSFVIKGAFFDPLVSKRKFFSQDSWSFHFLWFIALILTQPANFRFFTYIYYLFTNKRIYNQFCFHFTFSSIMLINHTFKYWIANAKQQQTLKIDNTYQNQAFFALTINNKYIPLSLTYCLHL